MPPIGDHAWREDAVLGAEGLDLGLGEVGVHLDLVDGRHDLGAVEQRGQVVDHEVADADRADLAVGQQRLQGAVGLEGAVERAGQRLVEDQQVDLLDAELAGALLEAVQRLVVAVVGDPDLRLQEHLGAVEAGGADRLADLALVAVGGGGVDVAVAGVERRSTASRVSSGGRLEDAEAEGGHARRRCSASGRGRAGVMVPWSSRVGSGLAERRGSRSSSPAGRAPAGWPSPGSAV